MENYDQELGRIKSVLRGSSKGLTVTEIARHIQINRNSVAKYLDILHTSGQVEMKAVGSAKIYSLTKRIPISSILSLSSDYIFVLDNNSVVTYVNDNVLNFERVSPNDIIGKPAESLSIAFFSVPDFHNLIRECLGGKEIIRELEVKKDNKDFVFRAKFVPSILENRKKGLLLLLEDITQIKEYQRHLEKTVADREAALTNSLKTLDTEKEISREAKDAFEESERRYRNLIEVAQEGIWTVDPEGKTTFVNRKLSEILGYTPEELDQQPIFGFADERNAGILRKYLQRLKSGRPDYFEVTFTRKDGSPVYTHIAASSRQDERGKFVYGLFLVSDITELKKTDDALRESEQLYRTLIETSPNGIIMLDPEGNIRMANRQAIYMLGYSAPGDVINRNLFDYIAPNDLDKVQKSLKRALDKGSTKSTECTMISNDSSAFCAELNISTIQDREGSPLEYVCIISDITERRKADHLIRKSEEKYRSLVEGISYIIFMTDTKGKFTYISPVIKSILGYTPEELTGKHFYKLIPLDDRFKLGLKLKEALTQKTGPNEFRMVDAGGKIHFVRIITQPMTEKDNPSGITGIIEDVTEFKRTEDALNKAELRYKAVVEDQSDLICRFTPGLTITFVNPAFARYYQKNENEYLSQSLEAIHTRKDLQNIRNVIATLTTETPVATFEHERLAPDNKRQWLYTTIRGIFNQNGEPVEFQSSSRDITDLKLYLEQTQKLLDEVQMQKSEVESHNEELKLLRKEAEISEKKYLDLYNFAPVGYLTLAPDQRISGINQTGAGMFGLNQIQITNRQLQEFIVPEDRETFDRFFNRIFESARKLTCEVRLIRNDGTEPTVHVEGKKFSLDEKGEEQARIVMIDITEQKKADDALKASERWLQAIISGSPVPIFVIDKNHRVVSWNKAMGILTGIKAKEVIGTSNHWKAFHQQQRPTMADLLVDGESGKINQYYSESATRSKLAEGAFEVIKFFPTMGENGKWLMITAAPVYDSKNTVIGALETIDDISSVKFAEEDVRKANQKLNTLTQVTRHDIINQLTILIGYIGALEEPVPDKADVKKYTEKVKNAAQAIQQLITFTRDYQNLGIELAKWHDLQQVIRKAAEQVNPQNIILEVTTGPVEIYADPLIERVFFNLINNSIQHGGKVSRISISFKENNDSGIITYEDDGNGIPAAIKNKLFNRGFSKNKGFGLFLSKEILNYHGISIAETSEPGGGARFEIGVPKTRYKLISRN